MSDDRFDQDLVDRFDQLRAEDRGRAPDALAMLQVARERASLAEVGAESNVVSLASRRLRPRLWLGGALVAAAATAGVFLVPSGDIADFDAVVQSYSQNVASVWSSPTAGLLEVPGIDLMRSVPSIGGGFFDPAAQPSPSGDNGRG